MTVSAASASADVDPVPVGAPRFTVPAGKIEDDFVWQALGLIDRSNLLAPIDVWENAERSGPGRRPKTIPVRALLVAMVLCAVTDQPMLATRFTDVLFRQISPTMRHALGVPKPPVRGASRSRVRIGESEPLFAVVPAPGVALMSLKGAGYKKIKDSGKSVGK